MEQVHSIEINLEMKMEVTLISTFSKDERVKKSC